MWDLIFRLLLESNMYFDWKIALIYLQMNEFEADVKLEQLVTWDRTTVFTCENSANVLPEVKQR